jgi:hypothetical protein
MADSTSRRSPSHFRRKPTPCCSTHISRMKKQPARGFSASTGQRRRITMLLATNISMSYPAKARFGWTILRMAAHSSRASSSFSGKAWFTRCLTCMKSQSSFSRSIRRGAIRKTSSLSIPKTGRQKASSKVSDAPDHRMRRSRGRFMPSEEFTLQSAFIWRLSGKKSLTTATCQLHKGVAILRYVFRGLMYLNMSSGGLKQCSRTHSSTYAGSCSSADP